MLDDRYGYMNVCTFKPFYFPGQIVRGYVVMNVFNTCSSKKLMIRIKGYEIPAKYRSEIIKGLKK